MSEKIYAHLLNQQMSKRSSSGSSSNLDSHFAKTDSFLKFKLDVKAELGKIPLPYSPLEWLGGSMPKRFPYFPQQGDDLVYLMQGHQMYIDRVRRDKTYKITQEALPWNLHPELEWAVPVRLTGIDFEVRPPHLVRLNLTETSWETKEPVGHSFAVSYHIPDLLYRYEPYGADFLVLWQVYEKSMQHSWRALDRFRCLINDLWWPGTIRSVEPVCEALPDSKYLCFQIDWDKEQMCNGTRFSSQLQVRNFLSPWNIERIPADFTVPGMGLGVPATRTDMEDWYIGDRTDWPVSGSRDTECDRIYSLLKDVMHTQISYVFRGPVSLTEFPDYARYIPYPMYLGLIKERLERRFYRRMEALKFDFQYIAVNAETFNEPGSSILKDAQMLRNLCFRICDTAFPADVHSLLVDVLQDSRNSEADVVQVSNRSDPVREMTPSVPLNVSGGLTETETEPPRGLSVSLTLEDESLPVPVDPFPADLMDADENPISEDDDVKPDIKVKEEPIEVEYCSEADNERAELHARLALLGPPSP